MSGVPHISIYSSGHMSYVRTVTISTHQLQLLSPLSCLCLPSSISANMEVPAELPLDILGHVADLLGAESLGERNQWDAVNALKMLCVTCKFMVPICRRHLFAHIVFSIDLKWKNGFNEFLLSDPIIVTHYVKNIYITITQTTGFSTSDYDLLQKICDSSSLTSIGIISIDSDWNGYSDKTKSVALSLIQKPTLRNLTLNSIKNFPAAALSLCSGLKKLSFYDSCSLAPPGTGDAVRSPAITTLVVKPFHGYNGTFASLLQPIGRNTVIAFGWLKNVSVSVRAPAEFSYMCQILERAICLERLELSGEFYALSAQRAYPDRLLNSYLLSGTAGRARFKPCSQPAAQTQIDNIESRLHSFRRRRSAI